MKMYSRRVHAQLICCSRGNSLAQLLQMKLNTNVMFI